MIWRGSQRQQRTTMRALYDLMGDDADAVCLAYVEAERAGTIARPSGAEEMTPSLHARLLWREAKLKGWFRS